MSGSPVAQHLLVTSEARVGLIRSGELPPGAAVSGSVLATLAVTCGPRALAVVLTGSQLSAEHFGMPGAAIGTGLVHRVLPLHDIAQAIHDHVRANCRR